MAQKYSEEFKKTILKRIMAPNSVPAMDIYPKIEKKEKGENRTSEK
jgi:hypothetical protein